MKKVDKTLREASYWAYAAWTAPFVALAVLIGEILIGTDSILGATSIAVVVTFVTTSVFWWWWAITKIIYMIKTTSKVEENFAELKKELIKLNKDLKTK
jgi:ABC-type uncharacterized transport system involved in gliding motility auxiliary subunit|tara:strand:+ start:4392 stop:4688 length:297 start_codon:yes stop_codon:yes gene_type:complete